MPNFADLDAIRALCSDAEKQLADAIAADNESGDRDNLTAVAGRKLVPLLIAELRRIRDEMEDDRLTAFERDS